MQTITIFTDGGARGNPGPAGSGAIIRDGHGQVVATISKFLGHKTNNFAEYEAVALALEEVKRRFGTQKGKKDMEIEVRMDSQLVARQLSGEYQIKEPTLFPQFIRVHNLCVAHFPNILFIHVRREENKEADKLANEAMDRGR
jgi:ribonuclease HI